MEKLMEHLRQQENNAQADYNALAENFANGEVVEPSKATDILRVAGKSTADLEKEVERLKRVAAVQTQVKELEGKIADAKKEEAELLADVVAKQEALQAATQAHEDACGLWNNSRYSLQAYQSMLVERTNDLRNLAPRKPKPANPMTDFPGMIRSDV
jgi:hypothetical protein